jgi:membrane-associated phospholipid phosphatase
MEWNLALFRAINNFALRNLFLDEAAIFLAVYLPYLVVGFLFLFWLSDIKKRSDVIFKAFLTAVFSRFVLTELIYFFWAQPRPSLEYPVHLLLENPSSSSFPSGHAAFFFALSWYFFFSWQEKNRSFPGSLLGLISLALFLAGFLISLGRIFAGLHLPGDITAGFLTAFFSAWLVKILFRKNPANNQ